jgi:hypothetical protein
MPNSVRTPRQGVSATSRRIAEAVDDEGWQEFRVGLKGTLTATKIKALKRYWNEDAHVNKEHTGSNCDVCIRVDNYIKALCRGGQLVPGQSLQTALKTDWNLRIKRI